MKHIRLVTLLATATLACAQATPEQQIVNDAAAALGGRDRVLAARTLVIEGDGSQGNLGQDVTPAASGQKFTVRTYRRAIDLQGTRARTELTRVPEFTYFQGQAETRQVNGVDGAIGYNVAASGAATRTNETVASDRRLEILQHPLAATRAALQANATLTNARTDGGQSLVDVTTADGQKFTLAIDTTTKLPARVVTAGNNAVLGDVALSTSFADYREVSGLQLPSRLTSRTDDFTTADIRATKQTIDGDVADLAAPADAAKAAPPGAAPPPTVAVQELGKGVWFLGGGTHNSVLVEFKDHLTLIETPQNDARALAVIAKARELRPDKPLTHVITTHHHFDHSGGVRAAISEGLTVMTRQDTASMLEDVANRPHSLVPDALSKNPKPFKVEIVDGDMVLTDGAMTVNLYTFSDVHAETMLYAYIPKDRILVEADIYNQGFAVHPYAANLVEELKKRNLRVDTVVPLHGQVATYAQFAKDAAAQPVATTH